MSDAVLITGIIAGSIILLFVVIVIAGVVMAKHKRTDENRNASPSHDELSDAWESGFGACSDEHRRQRADPNYPITRTNPYKAAELEMPKYGQFRDDSGKAIK